MYTKWKNDINPCAEDSIYKWFAGEVDINNLPHDYVHTMTPKENFSKTSIYIGIGAGVVLLIFIIIMYLLYKRKSLKKSV